MGTWMRTQSGRIRESPTLEPTMRQPLSVMLAPEVEALRAFTSKSFDSCSAQQRRKPKDQQST